MRLLAVKKLTCLCVAAVVLTIPSVLFQKMSGTTYNERVQPFGEIEQREYIIISDKTGIKQKHRIGNDIGIEQLIGSKAGIVGARIGNKTGTEQHRGNGEILTEQRQPIGDVEVSKTIPPFYPLNGTGTSVLLNTETTDRTLGSAFCKTDPVLNAIIPIYSAPDNFVRRQAIRDTVGKECLVFKCKLFFIIGISTNPSMNLLVRQEYDKHEDILIIDKIDTYRDLNNKAVAMLDWLMAHCQEPKYVIHIIDDTYPNLGYILKHLSSVSAQVDNKFILGKPAVSILPIRRKESDLSKWYLSKTEYPYDKFPNYIVGTAYAFLNKDCQLLREKVHSAAYVWIEDVWFTGLVAKAAGFTLVPFKTYPGDMEMPNLGTLATEWNTYPYAHNVSPNQYHEIYSISTSSIH